MNVKKHKVLIIVLLKMNWNMKITKKFCSMHHIWTIKWIEFKIKVIILEPIELLKFIFLVTVAKNIYLKMDTLGYHIFINLVNHRKIILTNIDNSF